MDTLYIYKEIGRYISNKCPKKKKSEGLNNFISFSLYYVSIKSCLHSMHK